MVWFEQIWGGLVDYIGWSDEAFLNNSAHTLGLQQSKIIGNIIAFP